MRDQQQQTPGQESREFKNKLNQVFSEVELIHNFFLTWTAGNERCKEQLETDLICPLALYKEPALTESGISERLAKLIDLNKDN